MFIDSHCHLEKLEHPALALSQARQIGVTYFLSIGIEVSDVQPRLDLLEKEPDVALSVGIHPLYIEECPLPASELGGWLKQQAQHPKIVGLGETGLDLQDTSPSLTLQRAYLWAHLEAAHDLDMPVIIHMRHAEAPILEIFEEFQKVYGKRPRCVFHCFTGTLDFAKTMTQEGDYLSLSGIVTFPNAKDLQDVVRHIALDHLLIETDAPWLAPVPYRGKPNQPAYILETAAKIAQLKGCTVADVGHATSQNFFTLFSKAKPC